MSHEPECTYEKEKELVRLNGVFQIPTKSCICQYIRAAYKRGREDAARATGAYVISNLDNRLETADFLDGLWKAAQETTIED